MSHVNYLKNSEISSEYLQTDQTKWNDNPAYQSAKSTIDSLQIVNDRAEGGGVKLIEDYNGKITKNEDQKQFLLQVNNKNVNLYNLK